MRSLNDQQRGPDRWDVHRDLSVEFACLLLEAHRNSENRGTHREITRSRHEHALHAATRKILKSNPNLHNPSLEGTQPRVNVGSSSKCRPWTNLRHWSLWALSRRSLHVLARSAMGRQRTFAAVATFDHLGTDDGHSLTLRKARKLMVSTFLRNPTRHSGF